MKLWVVDDPDDAETTISGPQGGEPGCFVAEDARLIAAAPELLAACEAILAEQEYGQPDRMISPEAETQLRSAIASASLD